MGKMCVYMYTHTPTRACVRDGILLSHKKNEIMPFAVTWLDLDIIILSEVKTEKGKYHIITYMWTLKK